MPIQAREATADMTRKKAPLPKKPMGPLLAKNLARLGYADLVVRCKDVAELVTKKTGKDMSRQRVAALMNAVNISDAVMANLAKGLGVKVEELMRDDEEKR